MTWESVNAPKVGKAENRVYLEASHPFIGDATGVPSSRLIRKCYRGSSPNHSLESLNLGIRQAQAAVKVIRHDTDGIVDRIL